MADEQAKQPVPFNSMSEAVKKALSAEQLSPAPPDKAKVKPVEQAKIAEPETKEAPEKKEEQVEKKIEKKGRFVTEEAEIEKPKEAPVEKPVEKPESVGIKQLRTEYEKAKKERDALKAELEQARASADPEEFKRVKQERDEILRELKVSALERTPEFKREYTAPLDSAVKRALELVPSESKPAIESLLRSAPTPERLDRMQELLENVSPARQSEVYRLAGEAADLIARRDLALESAGKERELSEQKTISKQKEVQERQRQEAEAMFQETIDAAISELPMFQAKDGDDKHNKAVESRIAKAKALLFGQNEPQQVYEAAVWAVVGQEILPYANKLKKLVEEKDKELEQLRSARPLAPKAKADLSEDKPKSFAEAVKMAMKG